MKNGKEKFLSLRKKVLICNKALIYTFALFMVYALVHSVSILDCNGVDYYNFTGKVTKDMITCDNLSSGLLTIFRNNNLLICLIFLIAAIIFLVIQKIMLLKINKMKVRGLDDEKVNKSKHAIVTLLLGYTGIHKLKTRNIIIGDMYLVNFIIFILTLIIKTFFNVTYSSYLVLYCTFEFSFLFLIGITILNVIDAFFTLLSTTDKEEKIFA